MSAPPLPRSSAHPPSRGHRSATSDRRISRPPTATFTRRPLVGIALLVLAACQGDPITAIDPSTAPRPAIAPSSVTVTDLGIPSGLTDISPTAINEAGDVVALGYGAGGYVYRGGMWSVFPDFEGLPAIPRAINDVGDIAANALSQSGPDVPFLRRGDLTTVLPPLAPGDFATVNDVNNSAVAVGTNMGVGTGVIGAVVWRPGQAPEMLPPLPGAGFSGTRAVNDAGQVIGFSINSAVLWDNGTVTDLGTLGGSFAGAADLNERGEVVGSSGTAAGPPHAFLWRSGVMTDLGTLEGMIQSIASGINDAGLIVGTSIDASNGSRAFVWEDGVMTALEPLPGYRNSSAVSITNGGKILGLSSDPFDSGLPRSRVTVWTVPVPPTVQPPEPSDLAERPWKGTCSFDDQQLSATVVRMTGTCTLSHMGRTTYVSLRTLVAGSATEFTSATTYTAANGDLLRTTGRGNSVLSGTGGEIGSRETVSGGTGRFSRASGTASLYGTARVNKQGVVTRSYELAGTLRYAASDRNP
jgi:probable HAF family extracellular repeat protein